MRLGKRKIRIPERPLQRKREREIWEEMKMNRQHASIRWRGKFEKMDQISVRREHFNMNRRGKGERAIYM